MKHSLLVNRPLIAVEFNFDHEQVFLFNHKLVSFVMVLIGRAQADPLDSF